MSNIISPYWIQYVSLYLTVKQRTAVLDTQKHLETAVQPPLLSWASTVFLN